MSGSIIRQPGNARRSVPAEASNGRLRSAHPPYAMRIDLFVFPIRQPMVLDKAASPFRD
jgi:hypothetical protein